MTVPFRTCTRGKPCGNSCIPLSYDCLKPCRNGGSGPGAPIVRIVLPDRPISKPWENSTGSTGTSGSSTFYSTGSRPSSSSGSTYYSTGSQPSNSQYTEVTASSTGSDYTEITIPASVYTEVTASTCYDREGRPMP